MLYLYLLVKNWLEREEGQDLLEYGMLAIFIAIVAVVAVAAFGQAVLDFFARLAAAAADLL